MKQNKQQYKTKIGMVAQSIPNFSYLHDTTHGLNFESDLSYIKFPLCFEQTASKGTLLIRNENIRDKTDSKVYFLDMEPMDANGEELTKIIYKMKCLASTFILEIKKSGLFEPLPDEIAYTVMQNWLDVGLTGIRLDTPLREKHNGCNFSNTIFKKK